MRNIFESAMVIARRDFVATVLSRTFVLFLLAPVFLGAFGAFVGQAASSADRDASQPVVALVADGATADAVIAARERLVAGTSQFAFPVLRRVEPAENLAVQAQRLLADQEAAYSAVFTGTLERPVLTGPTKVDESVGRRMQLVIEEARRTAALEAAGVSPQAQPLERVVTEQAAGNLRMIRRGLARFGQMLIFTITLMLATLLLSNLVEEKSNKVIEVLAASVPLDSVFLGKLLAMLAISLVGLVIWGGMLAIGFLFIQTLQDFMALPQVSPAVGWPAYAALLLLYYTTNYMLLGALFLGIGGQASNIREVQTLSMPITLMQLMVLMLSMTVVGSSGGLLTWTAYIFPLSSPMSMIALAGESELLWPHLAALVWQAIWVVIIIRLSASLFRKTVLKSGGSGPLFSFGRRKVAQG